MSAAPPPPPLLPSEARQQPPGAAGSYHSFGGMEKEFTRGIDGCPAQSAATASYSPLPSFPLSTLGTSCRRPTPWHGSSLAAEPFCFLCEDRGKKCVFPGPWQPALVEPPPCWKGEWSWENPAPQGSRSPGIQFQFCRPLTLTALPFLWASVSHMTNLQQA